MMEPEHDTSEEPWHLVERPLALAKTYLMRGDVFQVEDVSDLNVSVDLLVSPHEKEWTFGVVARGVVHLPDDVRKIKDAYADVLGISVSPSEALDLPLPENLPPIPVLYLLFEMETDAGYFGLLNTEHMTTRIVHEKDISSFPKRLGFEWSAFRLDNYENKTRVGLGVLRRLSLSDLLGIVEFMLSPDADDTDPKRRLLYRLRRARQ